MSKRLQRLIEILSLERGEPVPELDASEQRRYFRALVNVRPPVPAGDEYLRLEEEYLTEELQKMGIVDVADLTPVLHDLYLWKGDITTLKCDGIVNAANSAMLGCFLPNHGCIDNAIHTYAGVRLRLECAETMKQQGFEEPTGRAKITKSYCLPCNFVLHTVGPIVYGKLTQKNEEDLRSCYRSCLALSEQNGLKSLAFCCVSTGEFRFPNERAAEIAIRTVTEFKRETDSKLKVIFNVFREYDHEIYARLLRQYRET